MIIKKKQLNIKVAVIGKWKSEIILLPEKCNYEQHKIYVRNLKKW